MAEQATLPTRQANRRTAVRHACALSARFQVVGFHTDFSRPAVSRNISTGGVALLTRQPIRPGTCLRLYLHSADRETGIGRAVVVRHFTRTGPDQWLVGCSFSTELTTEELIALLT
jgi:hypothetical protein